MVQKLVKSLFFFSVFALITQTWAETPAKTTTTCQNQFSEIDRLTQKDIQTIRINQLPYLRTDRFFSDFKNHPLTNEELLEWLDNIFQLGISSWKLEMTNAAISSQQQESAFACAKQAIHALKQDPNELKSLLQTATVPDNYNDWKQMLGLYPIAKIPVQIGVDLLNIEIQEQFQQSTEVKDNHNIYNLFKSRESLSKQERKSIIQSGLKNNTLALPKINNSELQRLFSFYAPAFAIETSGQYDHIANLQYDSENNVKTNTLQPTIYTHHTYTRLEDKNYLQLVYTAWFPARPDDHPLDIYSGFLDGLMWRVTLDHEGNPLLYDSVHPCGCYHKIYPVSKRLNQKPAEPGEEIAFVLTKDIPDASKQPVLIHLNTRAHFVVALTPLDDKTNASYQHRKLSMHSYDELRALPTTQGSKSLFEPNGLVAGTERKEQWLIWPMGVEEAGAMRQWGTHATAFVSRRHFDEARLFERFFSIQ